MKIELIDGLLFASISITHQGKSKTVENVVIDTGASHSIISTDAVEELCIEPELEDEIVVMHGIGGKERALRKKIDCITFENLTFKEFYIDFGRIDDHFQINGLIGLDVLLKGGFIIDLKDMVLHRV